MAVDRPLTVRDYIEPRQAAVAGNRMARAAAKGGGSFRDLLTQEASAKSTGQPSGLSLSDYFARPVIFTQASRLNAAGSRTGSSTAPAAEAPATAAGKPTPRFEGEAAAAKKRFRLRPAGRSAFQEAERTRTPASGSDAIEKAIRRAASTYNLPPELIRSVIQAESAFRPDAVSPVGAQGLMQLMPDTAKELGVVDPFDIRQNIDGGARYLRQMLDRFGGDLKLALSAYNAGPGAVEKYEGQVPYAETRDYVKRVLRFAGLRA
ncbi:MAG: lytic transglycosylase domain-containing protein [Desulfobacterales bacterium]